MSYNIYVLFHSDFGNKYNIHILRPLLYAIIANLNKYAIKICGPPNFLFNYTDFGVVKNITKLSNYLNTYINSFLELGISNELTLSKSKVLDINDFYNEHVQNSPVFIKYGKRYIFSWKGENKNIYEIFENIKSIILNPSHILAFYDIYFKFIITTLFCEITVILDDLKLEYDNRLKSKIDHHKYINFRELFNDCLMGDNYPKHFSGFLNEIRLLLSYIFDEFYDNLIVSKDFLSDESDSGNSGLIKNISGQHNIKEDNVIDKMNDILLKVNKIENQINDIGVFIGFHIDQTFDGLMTTNSLLEEIIQLATKAKEYYLYLTKFKTTGQQLFLTRELCYSVKSVNEMISKYIINI